jgi:hypothetical protein
MKKVLIVAALLNAGIVSAQPTDLEQDVIRDKEGRITYMATEDGAVAFHYDMRAPFFSHIWTHHSGWIALPGLGEPTEDTLARLGNADTTTSRQLKTILQKPSVHAKCVSPIEMEGKADCYSGPPDIVVDVVASAPSRAWSGLIGGVGGPVSTRVGYPFYSANERFARLAEQRTCESQCERWASMGEVGCAFAAVIAHSKYVGLACSTGVFSSLQTCKSFC